MNKQRVAIYPGSFDPISNGHLDIIERTAKIFDTVYVLVSINPKKKYCFTSDERLQMMIKATKHLPNVVCEASNQLVLRYAQSKNACAIIRGLRNIIDYENEITLFQFNRKINPDIETILMFPSRDNLFLSSSGIKELVMFDNDISEYVPSCLVDEITKSLKERL